METDASNPTSFGRRSNRVPCRFHNHNGCFKGVNCTFSHEPDSRSYPDQTGRNVCLFFLRDKCKYDNKCVYSHSKEHLPAGGWWETEEGKRQFEASLIAGGSGAAAAATTSRPGPRTGRPRKPMKRFSNDYMSDDEGVLGYSSRNVNELLSQGVKPWDDDADDVMGAISGY